MSKYIKKSLPVKATRWFNVGDHPKVRKIAGFSQLKCPICDDTLFRHGYLAEEKFEENKDMIFVCPGDYIVEDGVTIFVVRPDVFELTYELIEE